MRTRSQRLLSMVLALSMLLTFLPVSAFAKGTPPPYVVSNEDAPELNENDTYEEGGNTYTYELNGTTATLTKFTGKHANVPETVKKDGIPYTVTAIGEYAFAKPLNSYGTPQYNRDLKSVILPGSIQTIEDYAFTNCIELFSLTTRGQTTSIPNGITAINDSTFAYCEKLNDFIFPDSVTSIGLAAFSQCHSFTKITLPDYLKTIGAMAFYQCERLDSVKIPVSVDTVGVWAFRDENLPTHTSKPFSEVYYTGTQTQWNELVNSASFDNSNTQLTAAKNRYYAHTVTFNKNGHGDPEKEVVQYNDTTTPISKPTADGYKFMGWFTEDGTEFDFGTKITKDTELFAHWEEEKKTDPEKPDQTPSKPDDSKTDTDKPGTPEKPNEPTPPEVPAVEEDDTAAIGYAAAAVTAAFVGWGAYRIGSEVYLKYLLPKDALLPQNRIQLAELLWEDAGRPAPADAAPYADVDANDTDARQAARWAVENGLLTLPDAEKPEEFAPYRSVSYAKSARAWNKAQQLKENAAR